MLVLRFSHTGAYSKHMKDFFLQLVSNLSPELATAVLATFPITELRAALPIAISVFALDPFTALVYAYLGNVVPLILVYLFLPPVISFAKAHSATLDHILKKYFLSLEQKYKDRYDRWGAIALVFFVAVPLPGSGVWTGSILAVLFGVEKRFSIPAILVGLALSGVIVLLITQGTLGVLSFLLI